MKRFCLIGIAFGENHHGTDTEDLSIVADNLPHALRQYAERIEQGKGALDLSKAEVIIIAGVSEDKAAQLERLGKN